MSKRLDRVLADCTWRTSFPEAMVEHLCRLHSYHNPILLRCGGIPSSPSDWPFRFEEAWILHPEYHAIVTEAWAKGNNCVHQGLIEVKDDSLLFKYAMFGNIFKRKCRLENRLTGIQRCLDNVDSAYLMNLEMNLQQEYNNVLKEEEILWYQKSREKWVKLGDRNTSFFHTRTIVRRRRNCINGLNLTNDRTWCTDGEML